MTGTVGVNAQMCHQTHFARNGPTFIWAVNQRRQTDGETGNSDRRYFSAPTGVAADGDCGVKLRRSLLGRKAAPVESRDMTLPTKSI